MTGERNRVADLPGRPGGREVDGRHRRYTVGADQRRRGVGSAVVVGDANGNRVGSRPVRARRVDAGRVAERSVAVEVPRVGERVAGIRVGGGRRVELDRERRGARRRRRGHACDWRIVRRHEAHAVNRPAVEVGVEEVAAGADLQVDRAARARVECDHVRRVRLAVAAGEHRPDAFPGVVGEEESAEVARGVGAAVVEGHAGDRRAPGQTGLTWHDLRAVVVRQHRRPHAARRVECLAEIQIGGVVGRLRVDALVARPAEVVGDTVVDGTEVIDLFPGVIPDVADPDVVRPRPDREPERIPQPVRDDSPCVGVGALCKGVVGEAGASARVDPDDRPVERRRVARRPHILAPQCTPLCGRRRERCADPSGRVAARVSRVAVLAPIGEVEARTLAPARVERPVGAEEERTDRVARVLLAPVVDEHLFGPGGDVARSG